MRKITFKHVLAFMLLISFNLIVYFALTKQIPTENRDIIIHSIGILEGYIGAIIMFYYGDSAGSKRKTEILNTHFNANKENNNPDNRNTDSDSSDLPG